MRFDKDNLPDDGEFREYRKIGTTRVAGPFPPPVEVETQEGEVLRGDTETYVALDAEGHPYPIKASVFDTTYEPVQHPGGVGVGFVGEGEEFPG